MYPASVFGKRTNGRCGFRQRWDEALASAQARVVAQRRLVRAYISWFPRLFAIACGRCCWEIEVPATLVA